MNMKKYLNWMLMATMLCGVSLGVISCSDDDDNNNDQINVVTIDQELLTHGISTDMQSAVIEIPVKTNGTWTAMLKKGTDWARILDWKVSFKGNQTLTLLIDENLTKSGRSTVLTIGNGEGDYQSISVHQRYDYNGEPPTNGSGLAFADKGLGTGIDYDYALNVKLKTQTDDDVKFEPTKLHLNTNVFNIKQIETLKTQGKLQASAYVEAEIPLADLQAQMLDSSLVQSKHVDMSLDLGVSFGCIEFEAHAAYNSTKDERRTYVDYTIVRNAPMYNVYISPAELVSYASHNRHLSDDEQAYELIDELIQKYQEQNIKRKRKNLNEDGLTEEQAAEIEAMYDAIPVNFDHGGIFSSNFCDRYNELYNAIERTKLRGKPIDTAAADATLNVIDNNYGPFLISGGDFGGSLIMHCKVNNDELEGKATFEGSVAAEMGGLFNVTGEFHYTEEGYSLMRNSDTKINIYGGNANDTADNMLGCIFSNNITDLDNWQDMLKGWLTSMYSDDGTTGPLSKAAPISYTITPIWTLFAEPSIQQYVQNYFMKKYASRGIYGYFGLMKGEENPGANGLLNSESDWWKNQSQSVPSEQ